jgi:MFS family permease
LVFTFGVYFKYLDKTRLGAVLREDMRNETNRVYGYRWCVLAAFMLITLMNQASWITFAPITSEAARYYRSSELVIGLLSMSFMAIYVLTAIPAAWAIDTWGFRPAVGVGALLTAAGALARGLFATRLAPVFIAHAVIALGQPLVLGSITKLASRWFPVNERATASGLGTLAIYLGILLAMFITPFWTIRYGIRGMLLIYGASATASAVLFLAAARERPPTPPGPSGQDDRSLMYDGLKKILKNRDFVLLMVIFFIGLGIFNGVITWIEAIVRPRGFSISQAGVSGGLMLIGGIVGALIMPMISDNRRIRKPFIVLALIGLMPGLLGLTFATSYWLLLACGFLFGFFLLSAGPIGFQYGVEISHPAPEGTSNSLLLLMGQISGILFILGMDAFKMPTGSMNGSLLVLLGLTAIAVLLAVLLRESPIKKSPAAIEIKEVKTRKELRTFIYLPEKIRDGHPCWVPPVYFDEKRYFDPKKNKAFSYSDVVLLLAYRGGEVVGRVMGIINRRFNERGKASVARFSNLETREDHETVHALIGAVEDWARRKGMTKIIGPYGFSDQDPEGFVIEGFKNRATIATYYNEEWMPRLIEREGYSKDIDYFVYKIEVPAELPEFARKIFERVQKRGRFELLEFKNKKELKPWIRSILGLMNECYANGNIYGYTPLDEKEMDDLAGRYLPVIDPRFVKAALKDHELVGFIVGMPDLTEGIQKAKGRLFPFGYLKILRAAKKTKQLDLLLGAIKDGHRSMGLDVMLGTSMIVSAIEAGMEIMDSHHEMEENVQMRGEMERMGGKVYKKFRVYQKTL